MAFSICLVDPKRVGEVEIRASHLMLQSLSRKIKGALNLRAHRNELLKLNHERLLKIAELMGLDSGRRAHLTELTNKVAYLVAQDGERTVKISELMEKVSELMETVDRLTSGIESLTEENRKLALLAIGKEMGEGPPVVVVNSLPKTGSQTIIHSLRAAGNMRVHHHHALSDDGIRALLADAASSQAPADTWNRLEKLKQTLNIRQDIVNEGTRTDDRRAYFICGVREPVSLFLSHVFQLRLERKDTREVGDGALDFDRLLDMMADWFATPSIPLVRYLPEPETWIRREILDFLQIDPFVQGFNKQAGYQVYSGPLGSLLLYRLEDLNRVFEPCMTALLGPLGNGVGRVDINTATEKSYSADYDQVRKNLVVPDALLDQIYRGQYAQTFYTSDEIEMFKARWRAGSAGRR